MRQNSKAIGSFIKLDDSVTSADRFVNVRDQQILRSNHNALLSGSHARVVLSDVFTETTDTTGFKGTYVDTAGTRFIHSLVPGVDNNAQMCLVYHGRVRLSQWVEKVTVAIRGKCSRAISTSVYAVLSRPGDNRQTTGAMAASMTFSSTSAGWQTADITIPKITTDRIGMAEYDLSIYYTQGAWGSTILGAPASIAFVYGSDGVVYGIKFGAAVDLSSVLAGDIMYFPSNTAIQPRVVRHIVQVAIVGYHLWADQKIPWVDNVPTNDDTVQFKQGAYLTVEAIQVFELARTTNFETLVGRI